MKKTIATAAILGCSALLTACGGSGSDGSAAPAPTVTVTESAAAESSTTSTTSPTSSSETTTSSSETTTTTESESGSRGSGGSGNSELVSDDFPSEPNYVGDKPSRNQEMPDGGLVFEEFTKSELSKAGLSSWTVKISDNDSVSKLTFPTMDSGTMVFRFKAESKGDSNQLTCSLRIFDANQNRVPDDEIDGNYENSRCDGGGFLADENHLGIAEPGEYILVFGVRNAGFDPIFMSIPVDIVE